MDERIKEHLKLLNRYYLLLLKVKETSQENFLADPMLQAGTERFLHLAIESCLNIGNRILSLSQFEKPIRTPETYADIFKELAAVGVIDSAFSDRLVKMAKFRNRLVHLYWDLDKETIYSVVHDNLSDLKLFERKILDYLSKEDV